MRFKFTKQGFAFPYHDDKVVRSWPWSRNSSKYSSKLVPHFNTLNEYWVYRINAGPGAALHKPMTNFSYQEVLAEWSANVFPATYVVVLHDVNSQARLNDFWKKLPPGTAAKLASSDVSVLICKDRASALEVSMAIPPDLGDSYLFKDGVLVDSNLWGMQ